MAGLPNSHAQMTKDEISLEIVYELKFDSFSSMIYDYDFSERLIK